MLDPFATSVVHEFIVLYTDRVLEKNKRWFDGNLRYFELNGKVQLQDLEGNVVAEDYTQRTKEEVLDKLFVPSKKYTFSNKSVIVDIMEKSATDVRDVSFLHRLNENGQDAVEKNRIGIRKRARSIDEQDKVKGKVIKIENQIHEDIVHQSNTPCIQTISCKPLPRIPRFSSKIFKVQK